MSSGGLLRNGDYLKLLSGQTISSLGSAMSTFVFTLLTMAISGSPVQALAATHGRQYIASLTGAPLGGLLYSVGRVVPVAVDALSYLVMTGLLATIRRPLPAAKPDGDAHEPMLGAIRSGLTWMLRQPALRTNAVVATVFNFAATGTLLVLILNLQQHCVRVQSAFVFLATSTNRLAPFAGGLLLATLGAREALLIFGGLLTLGAVLLTVSRSIRSIPLLSAVEPLP